MTFSICVREAYVDGRGDAQIRFGVAATTRLAGVGALCPFASENGAIATQSLVNVDLGRRGIEYVDDGLAIGDALEALLNADDDSEARQLHGVDADGSFVFSGDECRPWCGHRDGDSYTVAGNLLVGEAVVDAVADSYESSDRSEPLARRLIDALAAGYEVGGDRRKELTVQSAALLVESTEKRILEPAFNNLRVDASETPLQSLRQTYELAVRAHENAVANYGRACRDDSMDVTG